MFYSEGERTYTPKDVISQSLPFVRQKESKRNTDAGNVAYQYLLDALSTGGRSSPCLPAPAQYFKVYKYTILIIRKFLICHAPPRQCFTFHQQAYFTIIFIVQYRITTSPKHTKLIL